MNRGLSSLTIAAAALAGIATALPAVAQFARTDDAIKYRQSVMTVMNTHLGRIGAVVEGKAPYDPKTTIDNANIVLTMSRLPFAAFVPGSDKGDTNAKPEIWKEIDKFQAAARNMQEQAVKLDAAARSGSLDAIKATFGDTAKSCKACHDKYQNE